MRIELYKREKIFVCACVHIRVHQFTDYHVHLFALDFQYAGNESSLGGFPDGQDVHCSETREMFVCSLTYYFVHVVYNRVRKYTCVMCVSLQMYR